MSEKIRIIYLDQNKWSDLANAHMGRNKGRRYVDVLNFLREGVQAGRLLIPLSSAHIVETIRCSEIPKRRAIGELMVELSQGYMLAPMYRTIINEVVAVCNKLMSNDDDLYMTVPHVIGCTLQHAFVDDCNSSRIFETPISASYQLQWNRRTLQKILVWKAGRDDRAREAILSTLDLKKQFVNNAESFRRWEGFVDKAGDSLRMNFRDAANLRALLPVLDQCLQTPGADLEAFVSMGPRWMSGFLRLCPSLDVMLALQNSSDRNLQKQLEPNDVIDLSFLCVAIPYCDIVVTEKVWTSRVTEAKLDGRYGDKVIHDLNRLPEHILQREQEI